MSKLIIGDPHITEIALLELQGIFDEIYSQESSVKDYNELIMLGDYYDKKNPNTKEIIFGTEWAYKFKQKFKKVIFLRGNHDKTQDVSAIDYLQFLGIKVVDDYVDEYNNYYGHFMTNKSKFEYGTYKYTVKELKEKYNRVFLGHQHSWQELLKYRIYHIGSCRFIGFNEVNDLGKCIVYLQDEIKENEEPFFLELNSPILMKDVKSITELPDIDPNTKVRMVISSFNQFKNEINEISKYKKKFVDFKIKLDFDNVLKDNTTVLKSRTKKKLNELITQYIEEIEDKDVKELLKKQMEE